MYAGQVESARTNNRLDHPLGAAYLRRASDSMRNSMLPAATSIYEEAARRLYDAYDEGTSARHRVTVLAVGGTVLVLLVAAQVLVALRTRRVLNLGLVGATVIIAPSVPGRCSPWMRRSRRCRARSGRVPTSSSCSRPPASWRCAPSATRTFT